MFHGHGTDEWQCALVIRFGLSADGTKTLATALSELLGDGIHDASCYGEVTAGAVVLDGRGGLVAERAARFFEPDELFCHVLEVVP